MELSEDFQVCTDMILLGELWTSDFMGVHLCCISWTIKLRIVVSFVYIKATDV